MNTQQRATCQYIHLRASRLVDEALAVGVILTIETNPSRPPAMGNYTVEVRTRLARSFTPPERVKRAGLDLDALCDVARARIAAQIDVSAERHMNSIRTHNSLIYGIALARFKCISLGFRAETGLL